MIAHPENLPIETVVRNKIGELGRVITIRYNVQGKQVLLIAWAARGLEWLPVEQAKELDLV